MDNADDDKAAILSVLMAETNAWLRRDLNALAEHWVQSQQSRRLSSVAHHGIHVQEGWDEIFAAFRAMAKQYPETYDEIRIRRERMSIVVNGDMAWASFDQIGEKTGDNFELAGVQHELRIFHRVAGQWKINCCVILQRAIDQEVCPLIEIDANKKVLWMNGYAHEQLAEHPGLIISGGRLRARNRAHEADLHAAVEWASQHLYWNSPQAQPGLRARAVFLGENDNAVPVFCWAFVEDGKIMLALHDDKQVMRSIEHAQGIYRLTAAQTEVARLLAQGNDPALAAESLGVSINTVRTHMQRLFEKTGVRSQSALVALLLSAEAPKAR